jgi:hypothetical protein
MICHSRKRSCPVAGLKARPSLSPKAKEKRKRSFKSVYGGMKLKTYVKNAVFVEGMDGIENGGKMIGHDWMLRRKGEGRGEDAGLERKNPADGEG